MKPNFEPGKWFMQCVGIDIAKSTFTACLCMSSIRDALPPL